MIQNSAASLAQLTLGSSTGNEARFTGSLNDLFTNLAAMRNLSSLQIS